LPLKRTPLDGPKTMWLVLFQIGIAAPSMPGPSCDSLLGVAASRVADSLGGFDICLPGEYRMRTYPTGHLWMGSGRQPTLVIRVDSVPPPTIRLQAKEFQELLSKGGRCEDCIAFDSLTYVDDSTGPRRQQFETALISGGFVGHYRDPVFQIIAEQNPLRWVTIRLQGLHGTTEMVDRIGRSVRWMR
jgi:hypothetical protein